MGDAIEGKAQGRGRPPKNIDRDVIQDLMRATEAALTTKATKDITIHEIAAAAGVNDAMIHYYFGGKDGLLVAIFDEIMRDAPYQHADEIIADCVADQSIKPLITRLSKFYSERRALIRMAAIEFNSSSSKLEMAYRSKYYDVTPKFIEKLICTMMDAGIYHRQLEVTFIISCIFSIVIGPVLLLGSTKILSISGKIYSPEWIDETSFLLDRALKV